MEELIITVTHWNVIIEYNGKHGVTTAYRNYRRYNGQFNFGFSGSGPATLVTALLEVLYMDNEEVQDYRQWRGIAHIKGYDIINNVVVLKRKDSEKNELPNLCGQFIIEVTEEMIAIFPFLQQKKDLF
jgi:hypothetical protein